MKFCEVDTLNAGGFLLLLSLTGCGGSGDDPVVDLVGSELAFEAELSVVEAIQDDGNSLVSALQCDVADFDIAELVFTESDRQWSCSVSSSQTVSSDAVFFSQNGTAVFAQHGTVYWNRNLIEDTLTIASPLIPTLSLKDINSANTTLQFTLGDGAATDAVYDCVLVQRDDVS